MPSVVGSCLLGKCKPKIYAGQVPTVEAVEILLGNAELGRLLAVSRQRVSQLVARDDFPTPRAKLTMGSIWALPDVLAWAEHTGRKLHLDALEQPPAHNSDNG